LGQIGHANAGSLGELLWGQSAILAPDAHRIRAIEQRISDLARDQFLSFSEEIVCSPNRAKPSLNPMSRHEDLIE